jgi:hypothetical protein
MYTDHWHFVSRWSASRVAPGKWISPLAAMIILALVMYFDDDEIHHLKP